MVAVYRIKNSESNLYLKSIGNRKLGIWNRVGKMYEQARYAKSALTNLRDGHERLGHWTAYKALATVEPDVRSWKMTDEQRQQCDEAGKKLAQEFLDKLIVVEYNLDDGGTALTVAEFRETH